MLRVAIAQESPKHEIAFKRIHPQPRSNPIQSNLCLSLSLPSNPIQRTTSRLFQTGLREGGNPKLVHIGFSNNFFRLREVTNRFGVWNRDPDWARLRIGSEGTESQERRITMM